MADNTRMHYLLPTHLAWGVGESKEKGPLAAFSKGSVLKSRTGDTMRWPSFTQYDSAYMGVLFRE